MLPGPVIPGSAPISSQDHIFLSLLDSLPPDMVQEHIDIILYRSIDFTCPEIVELTGYSKSSVAQVSADHKENIRHLASVRDHVIAHIAKKSAFLAVQKGFQALSHLKPEQLTPVQIERVVNSAEKLGKLAASLESDTPGGTLPGGYHSDATRARQAASDLSRLTEKPVELSHSDPQISPNTPPKSNNSQS